MSVAVPNPLVLSPENVLAAGAASTDGQDEIVAKIEELRAATASPELNTQELLAQILVELRVMNLYLYEMPRVLNDGIGHLLADEPEVLRNYLAPE